jgi:hypothetical protein
MRLLTTALLGIALTATPNPARAGMDDAQLQAYILQNLPAGEEPNAEAVNAIGVGELGDALPEGLSENVRAPLQGAIDEINDKTVPGTPYNAWVTGIYEVIAAGEVVGYAVQGRGVDFEWDFNDAMTYGFNLQGGQVAFEHQDW